MYTRDKSRKSNCFIATKAARYAASSVAQSLTDHYVDVVTGVMPFDVGTTRGPGSNGRIDYPGYGMIGVVGDTPGLRAGLCAFSDAGVPGYYDNGLPGGSYGADTVGRLIGNELKETMSDVDRLLNINR